VALDSCAIAAEALGKNSKNVSDITKSVVLAEVTALIAMAETPDRADEKSDSIWSVGDCNIVGLLLLHRD
jgi:hypothetical protein